MRRASGDDAPLLGVPIAVKDNHDVAGELTTHGTGCVDEPAREDSELIRRLRAAGAIVIGKTNLPELAIRDVHRVGHLGRDPQPVGPHEDPGRIVRRQRRRRRRGPRRRRDCVRRRRLHPLSGLLLRAVRAQAAARPGADRPGDRGVARDVASTGS